MRFNKTTMHYKERIVVLRTSHWTSEYNENCHVDKGEMEYICEFQSAGIYPVEYLIFGPHLFTIYIEVLKGPKCKVSTYADDTKLDRRACCDETL